MQQARDWQRAHAGVKELRVAGDAAGQLHSRRKRRGGARSHADAPPARGEGAARRGRSVDGIDEQIARSAAATAFHGDDDGAPPPPASRAEDGG